jgi:signal transduction histidine kinase
MRRGLRDVPIRTKLRALFLLTSGIAVVVALGSFLAYDVSSHRQFALRALEVLSAVARDQLAPALASADAREATEILESVEGEPEVLAAAVYDSRGNLFARRVRPGVPLETVPDRPPPEGFRFEAGHLLLTRPVRTDDQIVGTLFLRSDMAELRTRLTRLVGVAAAALAVALLAAFVLGTLLEGLLTGPILRLERLMQDIRARRDFSVRAPKEGQDELGRLIDGFNGMLAEIENLTRELRGARDALEERVRERTQELESFAYTISHDLRAPLRGMQGFSHALLEDYGERLDETGRDFARRIAAAAERLDALIQDLLTYSRLTHIDVRMEKVPLEEVVNQVLRDMAPEIRERKAQVRMAERLPPVRAHRVMLTQVLVNLVSNAIKFVARGVEPRVEIRAEPRDGRVRLWVEDNGIGIAAEYHERIFRMFERLNRQEDYPGTGIGLAIVRKATERMGGTAGVESEPGRGSRFWIELEAAAEL